LAEWTIERQSDRAVQLSTSALGDIEGRALASIQMLDLPESADVLADRFVHNGYIEAYLAGRRKQQC
jgi:hypothetical protein